MRIYKFQFYVVFIVIILNSCSRNYDLDEGIVIPVGYKESDYIVDSMFVDVNSVQYVYLQDSLGMIGEVSRLIVTDNRYVVFDKSQKAVWVYTKEGKFISKINKIGRGAGEYSSAWNITTNFKNEIGIIDDNQKCIMWYDEEGAFVSQINLLGYPIDAYVRGNNIYVMYRNIDENLPIERNYYLQLLGLNGDFEKGFFKYHNPMLYAVNEEYLVKREEECFLSMPFENKLFTLANSQLAILYSFDFGGNPNAIEKIKNAKTAIEHNEIISTIGLHANAHNFQISDDYLTCQYTIKDGSLELSLRFVYNRKNGRYKNLKGTDKAGLDVFYSHPLASDHKFFYSVVYPFTMSEKALNTLVSKKITENDNPVIMRYEYKF